MKTRKKTRLLKKNETFEGIPLELEIRKAKEEKQPLKAGTGGSPVYEERGEVNEDYDIRTNKLEQFQKVKDETYKMRRETERKWKEKMKIADENKRGESAPAEEGAGNDS